MAGHYSLCSLNCFVFKGDDPSVDKKLEGDKRGISDYNGEMRRGGRGGGGYRIPSSKDMGPVDMGPYGEKVKWLK